MPLDPSLPRCTVFMAVSVDGFIARPDDDLGWLDRVRLDGEDYGYAELMRSVDVLVLGRRTYEIALGFEAWPYAGKRCIVLGREPGGASRHGEEHDASTPVELVARLRAEGARHLYIDGGQLVRSFLRAGLVHDLVLSVVPVVLGAGVPLWSQDGVEVPLRLESSRSWPTGLVQLRYAVASTASASPPG